MDAPHPSNFCHLRAATCSKTPALVLRSSSSGTENPISRVPAPRLLATIFTRRSGWEKGSERNKTAFTMLKIAVFATPKTRESTATMVKPGLFQSTRRPYRISCNNVVIAPLEWLTLNSNIQTPKPMSSTLAQGDDRVYPGRAPRRYVARQKYNHHEDQWHG